MGKFSRILAFILFISIVVVFCNACLDYLIAKAEHERLVQRQTNMEKKYERFAEMHEQEEHILFPEGIAGRLALIEQEISFMLDYYKNNPINDDAELERFDKESSKLANLFVQATFERIFANSPDPKPSSGIEVFSYDAGDLGREFKAGDSVKGEQIIFSNGYVYQGGVQIDNSPLSGFVTDFSTGFGELLPSKLRTIDLNIDLSEDFPDGYYNFNTRFIYHPKYINLNPESTEIPVQVPNSLIAVRDIFLFKFASLY